MRIVNNSSSRYLRRSLAPCSTRPGRGVECALQGAPYAHIAPVPYTDGPFTTAVGPDGIIVNAQQPMTLYPNEWSAMAQGGIPHDCPRPTAKEDKEMCE